MFTDMKIILKNKKVNDFSLKQADQKNQKSQKNQKNQNHLQVKLTFKNELFLNASNKKLFRLRFKGVCTCEGVLSIDFSYDFDFEADTEFSHELINHPVVRSVAPSMAFPYMKQYIETVISMSGYRNLPELPHIDFTEQPMPEFKEQ